MADEAIFGGRFGVETELAPTTINPYELRQTPTGRAGFLNSPNAVNSGLYFDDDTANMMIVAKATGMVILKGGRVYLDYSTRTAKYFKANDRDFYLGRAAETAGLNSTNVKVIPNIDPHYDIDLLNHPYITALVGTSAVSGFGYPVRLGGALQFELTATNEAQKVDALAVDGFSPAANAIVEMVFRVVSDGAGTVVDLSAGVASATHASDADSIAEHLFVHLDANDVDINLQSKDGSTTVTSTDTTYDYTEGSTVAVREEIWMDFADPADVQVYRNGVLALPSTVFNLGAAVGPLFPLIHLEKTASTDAYRIVFDRFCVRLSEQ